MFKKTIVVLAAILCLSVFTTIASAEGEVTPPATDKSVIAQLGAFVVKSPMETGAVGFWFPADGSFAAGVAHTFLRVNHTAMPELTFDVDATIAQEVNQEKSTLGGIGLKLGYNLKTLAQTGFAFAPSLGLTALNDFSKYHNVADMFTHYKVAVYGTVLLYKW